VSASDDGQRLDVGVGRLPGRDSDTLMVANAAGLRRPGCDFVDGYRLQHDRPGYVVYMRVHRNATGQSWRKIVLKVIPSTEIERNHGLKAEYLLTSVCL